MIVSLPMYDWPEIQEYTDRFWARMQRALLKDGIDAPEKLIRGEALSRNQEHKVLLSQTCAYPLITRLPESTQVVGTPIYNVDLTNNGLYASTILVRQHDNRDNLSDFRNAKLAFNGVDSQSGYNSLKSLLVSEQLLTSNSPPFFSSAVCSGSHRHSIRAVANGHADICAIDPVSWALAKRYDPDAKKLSVLTHTAYAPALPLISHPDAIPADMDSDQWRALIMHAFKQSIDQHSKQHLLISDITYIEKSTYFELPISNLDMVTN